MLRIVVSRWGQDLGASDHEVGLARVGSGADDDLQIPHEDLTAYPFEVFLGGPQAFVRSVNGKTLRVDGHPVKGVSPLGSGQSIQVGDFSFRVCLVPADVGREAEPGVCGSGRAKLEGTTLVALLGPDGDEQMILSARRVLLGRGADEGQLARLQERGIELARVILEHHSHQGLDGLAGEVRASSGLELAHSGTLCPPQGATASSWLGRWVLPILALLAGGLLALRLWELVRSFTR